MPLVSMRQLLDHAAENGYGIPAFNVNNLEQVQAVMEAAKEFFTMRTVKRASEASRPPRCGASAVASSSRRMATAVARVRMRLQVRANRFRCFRDIASAVISCSRRNAAIALELKGYGTAFRCLTTIRSAVAPPTPGNGPEAGSPPDNSRRARPPAFASRRCRC